MQTDGLTMKFFEASDWELVAESFDPDYSLFEDRDPGLHSLVVAYTPIIQRDLYVCEFVYDSKQALQQRQKDDLQQALETVHEMLN